MKKFILRVKLMNQTIYLYYIDLIEVEIFVFKK